jgi:hypothetical protein
MKLTIYRVSARNLDTVGQLDTSRKKIISALCLHVFSGLRAPTHRNASVCLCSRMKDCLSSVSTFLLFYRV